MKANVLILSIIFLLAASPLLHAKEYTQTITISERNSSLEKIFKQIEKQTGYLFVYRDEWLQQAGKVTIDVKNATLEEVLDLCFRNQSITYSIVERTIVIRRKERIEKKDQQANAPLPINIRGRVINENRDPVAGATVSVKSTSKAAITNENGEFLLNDVPDNASLVISSVSFETQEVPLNGRSEIVIQLKIEIGELSSVSVTVSTGYQVLPKERVTGSFAQPDKQMYGSRVAPDVISKLEGITSGLVFNRSRTGGLSLGIRGRSTIFANDQPLIVVDNFPYDGDINNINPNDIESVTILKDAAAASIWGVQAGNGVIVISTKRGKFNQPLKVELNTNITVQEKPDLFYDPQFLNSKEFIDVEAFLFGKGFYNADFNASSKVPISPVVEILNQRKLGLISAADSATAINALRGLDVRNEMGKYFYRRAVNQQYSLSLSGGSNKAAYFLSVGFDKNRASLTGNQSNRITLNSITTFTPAKGLEITGGINYIQWKNESNVTASQLDAAGSGKSYKRLPYTQLADAAGNPLPILKDYRSGYADTAGGGKFLNWHYYPLQELALSDNTGKQYDIRLNAGIKYTILKGLSAELKYQYEKGISESRNLQTVETYYARNLVNQFTTINPDGSVKRNIPVGGILNLMNSDLTSARLRGQVNYNGNWNKNDISVIAGAEAAEIKVDGSSGAAYGYDPLTLTSIPVNYDSTYSNLNPEGSALIPYMESYSGTLNRFRSYFLNAAYTYNNRYVVSVSGRIDQSNFFGVKANQRSVPLWSVGGKWNIDNESFYHIAWLPSLKLRTTYGYSGNLDKSVTAYTTGRYEAISAGIVNLPYVTILTPPNPELQWEKTAMLNIGVDFGLQRNIITGSIEYFRKKGIDLMGDVLLAPSIGYYAPNSSQSIRGNFAGMKGEGIDVVLNTRNIDKSFKWTTTFLFSYATDEVTSFDRENTANTAVTSGTNIYPVVGKPVYSIYSYAWGGLDSLTGEPMGYLNKTLSKDYAKLANPTEYSELIYNGPARPVFFGGLINNFSWKGFSLRATISYKLGYYFRRSSINYGGLFRQWEGHEDFSSRWQKPGDEKTTYVPAMLYPINNNRDNFYTRSSVLVEKGDHIRLQDISLSYDLDKSQLKVLPLKHIQLYIYANNIGILWRANQHDIDPDYQSGFPAPRSMAAGLRATF